LWHLIGEWKDKTFDEVTLQLISVHFLGEQQVLNQ
jgi:hypothetical protein